MRIMGIGAEKLKFGRARTRSTWDDNEANLDVIGHPVFLARLSKPGRVYYQKIMNKVVTSKSSIIGIASGAQFLQLHERVEQKQN